MGTVKSLDVVGLSWGQRLWTGRLEVVVLLLQKWGWGGGRGGVCSPTIEGSHSSASRGESLFQGRIRSTADLWIREEGARFSSSIPSHTGCFEAFSGHVLGQFAAGTRISISQFEAEASQPREKKWTSPCDASYRWPNLVSLVLL